MLSTHLIEAGLQFGYALTQSLKFLLISLSGGR
jgi:hypothetical protein